VAGAVASSSPGSCRAWQRGPGSSTRCTAAQRVDAQVRKQISEPDQLGTLFLFGFLMDKRLDERLVQLKWSDASPARAQGRAAPRPEPDQGLHARIPLLQRLRPENPPRDVALTTAPLTPRPRPRSLSPRPIGWPPRRAMDKLDLDALVSGWEAIRGTTLPVAPLVERLQRVWQTSDETFAADPDPRGVGTEGKWVCRRLWEQLQAQEADIPPWLRGLLARTGIWSTEEAVISTWVGTSSRRSENRDARYFDHDLRDLLPCVAEAALPALIHAVVPLDAGLAGRFAVAAVHRLTLPEMLDAARAALRLAHDSTDAVSVLEHLAPHLGPEERERGVHAVWEMVRKAMERDAMACAVGCADWARLLPLSTPATRADRCRALVAAVAALPVEWHESCPDYDDLRGLVAIALADLGETAPALEWVERVPAHQRVWVLVDVLPHLEAPLCESLALGVVGAAAKAHDRDGWLLARLASVSKSVARACVVAAGTRAEAEGRLATLLDLLPFLDCEEVTAVLSQAEGRARSRALEALERRATTAELSAGEMRWLTDVLAAPTVDELLSLAGVIPLADAGALFEAIERLTPLAHAEGDDGRVLEAVAVLVERAGGWCREHQARVRDVVRRAPDGFAEAPGVWALLDDGELVARANRELARSRSREAPRTSGSARLIYELCAMPRGAVQAPGHAVARLAGPSRSALAEALWGAGPWGRSALLSRIMVGWHHLVECLLSGRREIDLDEAEILAACGLASGEVWIRWLDEHPPLHLMWAFEHLDVPERVALGPLLGARPELPPWARPLCHFEPVGAVLERPIEKLGAEDLALVEAARRDPPARNNTFWLRCALRWGELGEPERARAALDLVISGPERDRARFTIALSLGRGEAVLEALRAMRAAGYDPAIDLFRSAARAASAGFVAEVLVLTREITARSVRLGLQAILSVHAPSASLQSEIEAEVGAALDAEEEVGDDAFGRVAPRLGERVRARMWGSAFSRTWLERALPFSWRTCGALEVIASLRGGDVEELVEWVVRIRGDS